MKYGIADYGMNVYEGGLFDLEERLVNLKQLGYSGIERLEAADTCEAVNRAVTFHRTGMDFATCRGPRLEQNMEWSCAFGKDYIWLTPGDCGHDVEMDTFIRRSRNFCRVCAKYGISAALHNHLGSRIENQEELDFFLKEVPEAKLLLDIGHLALAVTGGAAGHGFLLAESALPVLAGFNLGIENFNGLAAHVGSDASAALAAFRAVCSQLGGVGPAGNGYMAEHGVGNAGRQITLHALSGVTGLIDGEGRLFIPAEQLVHHGRGFLAGIEHRKSHGRAGKRTIVTYLYEVWIVDDRRERQVTALRSQQELDEKYKGFPHDGLAIAAGKTGNGNAALAEYRCQWGSNPEATANVLVAHARAVVRLAREGRKGAFTILDIPASYFTTLSREELLKHWM